MENGHANLSECFSIEYPFYEYTIKIFGLFFTYPKRYHDMKQVWESDEHPSATKTRFLTSKKTRRASRQWHVESLRALVSLLINVLHSTSFSSEYDRKWLIISHHTGPNPEAVRHFLLISFVSKIYALFHDFPLIFLLYSILMIIGLQIHYSQTHLLKGLTVIRWQALRLREPEQKRTRSTKRPMHNLDNNVHTKHRLIKYCRNNIHIFKFTFNFQSLSK